MKTRLLALLLALCFLLTGCVGPVEPAPPSPTAAAETAPTPVPPAAFPSAPPPSSSESPAPELPPSESSAPVPTSAPAHTPAPAPSPEVEDTPRCTLSISCAVLAERREGMDGDIRALVPEDGWLLPPTQVELREGDSVFDLLLRTCQAENIRVGYSATFLGSVYIEGIGSLYEMDFGGRSGWLYAVNGVSPNRSCSEFYPREGDDIRWCYTCDLGDDLPHITRG